MGQGTDGSGAEGAGHSRLPWKNPSRQQEGRQTEGQVLRRIGAIPHSNSGAGQIKEDGHTDTELIEVKDAMRSFTLKGEDLKATFTRAVRQEREAVWLIIFKEAGLTAELRIKRSHPSAQPKSYS